MRSNGSRESSDNHPAWRAVAGDRRSRPDTRHVQPWTRAQAMSRRPIWDKNNVGFWLTVCVLISLLFSVIYRAMV